MFSRHLDLYEVAAHSVRFPIPNLGLKEVGDYLDFERVSGVTDGFEAVHLYAQMDREPDPAKKAALHARLTDYCAEDIDALVYIARQLERGFSDATPPGVRRARADGSMADPPTQP